MADEAVKVGATDVELSVRAFDVNGATSVAYNAAGFFYKWRRAGGALSSAISLASQTVAGIHTDNGWVHKEAGEHRFDAPDTPFAAPFVPFVQFFFYGVTGALFQVVTVKISNGDPRAAPSKDVNVTEVDGVTLASGAKMPSQVKGMDPNTLDGSALATSAVAEMQGGLPYQVAELLMGAGLYFFRENGTNIEMVRKSDSTVMFSVPRVRSLTPLNPVTQIGA